MKKLWTLIFALCLCILPVYAADALPWSAQDWAVLRLTNERRMAEGLSPLSVTTELWQAASVRCAELRRRMDHTRPDGRDCFSVLEEHQLSAAAAGENVAAGQSDAASVVDAWMNSEGHRENILNGRFSHMGAAYLAGALGDSYISYWSQLYIDDYCRFSDLRLLGAEALVVPPGTPAEDLRVTAELTCAAHGASYLPVIAAMCSGYDPSVCGSQTVTVSCCGQHAVFTVEVSADAAFQTPVASSSSMAVFQPRSDYYYLFSDVSDSAWYRDDVYLAVVYGLLGGTGSGDAFRPDDPLTVAQTLMIAARIRDLYNGGDGVIPQDGPAWYSAAQDYCVEQGIVPAGAFPDAERPATRAEVAAVLAHALPESELNAIRGVLPPDVADADPYAAEIRTLYRAGILTGSDSGVFGGGDTIRRCEAAAVLIRLILPARRIG